MHRAVSRFGAAVWLVAAQVLGGCGEPPALPKLPTGYESFGLPGCTILVPIPVEVRDEEAFENLSAPGGGAFWLARDRDQREGIGALSIKCRTDTVRADRAFLADAERNCADAVAEMEAYRGRPGTYVCHHGQAGALSYYAIRDSEFMQAQPDGHGGLAMGLTLVTDGVSTVVVTHQAPPSGITTIRDQQQVLIDGTSSRMPDQ